MKNHQDNVQLEQSILKSAALELGYSSIKELREAKAVSSLNLPLHAELDVSGKTLRFNPVVASQSAKQYRGDTPITTNDLFYCTGIGLAIVKVAHDGQTPKPQYTNYDFGTAIRFPYVDENFFKVATGEATSLRSLFRGKLEMKRAGTTTIFEIGTDSLELVPEYQYRALATASTTNPYGTASAPSIATSQMIYPLSTPRVISGNETTEFTIDLGHALAYTGIDGVASGTNSKNFALLILSGILIKGGAKAAVQGKH